MIDCVAVRVASQKGIQPQTVSQQLFRRMLGFRTSVFCTRLGAAKSRASILTAWREFAEQRLGRLPDLRIIGSQYLWQKEVVRRLKSDGCVFDRDDGSGVIEFAIEHGFDKSKKRVDGSPSGRFRVGGGAGEVAADLGDGPGGGRGKTTSGPATATSGPPPTATSVRPALLPPQRPARPTRRLAECGGWG